MLNRILTLALMLSVVICCIFVFTEDPPELEQTGPLPILMYHDVTDAPTSDNPMVVTTEKLEGDLCWLKENGYHTILPRELTAGEPLPEKPVMITFDDGYVSNYRLLFPLLQKYQMKAAICLIVSLTDKDPEGHGHLTWDMCREMQASGLVEIASHTYALHNLEQNGDYFAKGVNGIQRKTGESSWQFQIAGLDRPEKEPGYLTARAWYRASTVCLPLRRDGTGRRGLPAAPVPHDGHHRKRGDRDPGGPLSSAAHFRLPGDAAGGSIVINGTMRPKIDAKNISSRNPLRCKEFRELA